MDRIERSQRRHIEGAGRKQEAAVEGEQRGRVEHLAGSVQKRGEKRLVVPGGAPDRSRISVKASSQETRSESARKARSASLSGSSRTSFASVEAEEGQSAIAADLIE